MALSTQEFKEILLYPIQDKQWLSKLCVQVGVLFLLCFVMIGFPFLFGYMIRCAQKAIAGDTTLPGWNEWGIYWKLGWKAIAVSFIFSIPLFVLWLIFFVGMISVAVVDELSAISDAWYGVVFLVGACFYVVLLIYSLVMTFVQPAYVAAIAASSSIKQAINLGWLWQYVKANALNIIIGLAILYLAGLISMLGFFVMFIGFFLTYGYAIATTGYAYGLIYRKSNVKV